MRALFVVFKFFIYDMKTYEIVTVLLMVALCNVQKQFVSPATRRQPSPRTREGVSTFLAETAIGAATT